LSNAVHISDIAAVPEMNLYFSPQLEVEKRSGKNLIESIEIRHAEIMSAISREFSETESNMHAKLREVARLPFRPSPYSSYPYYEPVVGSEYPTSVAPTSNTSSPRPKR